MPQDKDRRPDEPAYRRLADQIIDQIRRGERLPGQRLPTLRQLARLGGLSLGTVKHVYDVLEQEGHIVKRQGTGTFVREAEAAPRGGKAQAMAAIDRFLDEMQALAFSWRETRIFIDLKLREREQSESRVRVGVVDCSPEAVAMMKEQILLLPHAEAEGYPLEAVLAASRAFEPPADLVVTTTTHGDQLAAKMPPGREPVRLVMSLDAETAVALAAIDPGARVGVVCQSERFAQIILAGCKKYCRLTHPIEVARLGGGRVEAAARESDVLILAPNYALFASAEEAVCLARRIKAGGGIPYRYQVERGSLVYLESRIEAHRQARRAGL